MEKKNNNKKRPLINELTQGKELANQLKNHFDKDTSLEACVFLVEKIVSSYEKALSMLNMNASLVHHDHRNPFPLESPPNSFVENSPTSDNSDLDSNYQCKKNAFKKRKIMPQWSEQVKVSSGTMAVEGPLGDGYNWRKYGQKDILGANFPRSYYRCTHRNVQGCLATKQVQKSDHDPSIVEVTYKGRHTCIEANHLNTALALAAEKKVQSPNKEHRILESQTQDMHFNSETCLKAQNLENFPSFSFASTLEVENMDGNYFLESMSIEDNFVASYSPSFMSLPQNVQTSDSELTDLISTLTSVTNSSMTDFDFQLEELDFDSNFSIDNILESEHFY